MTEVKISYPGPKRFGGSLANYGTRRLLAMLAVARRSRFYDPHDEDYGYDTPSGTIPVADIKTELAGREHLPNKAERRAIRQQKAKNRG